MSGPKHIGECLKDFGKELERVTVECPEHGPYVANVSPVTKRPILACPKCAEEMRNVQEQENERAKQVAVESRREKSGIPPRFKAKTLEDFIPEGEEREKALMVATGYARNFPKQLATGRSIVFYGTSGAGKTHLACGIANEVIKQGHYVCFTSVYRLVRSVKATYAKDSPHTEEEVISGYLKPDLLILDEVGVQFGTDTEKLILFEVINSRYEHMRPTILLSNLTLEEMNDYLGDRLMDRLRENHGLCIGLSLDSWRGRA